MGTNLNLNLILLVAGAAIFQLAGVSFLPASRGMTAPLPTLGVIVCYAIGITCMGRLFVSGMGLGLVVPLVTLIIIIGAIAVGMVLYGDNPSPAKLALVVGAVGLMVLSSRF